MKYHEIKMDSLRIIWTVFLILRYVVFSFNYKKTETIANCLGIFCDSDPSLVTYFNLSIGCPSSKPCINAEWLPIASFDTSQRNKYRLKYRIVSPDSLRNNYSIHELTDEKYTMDTQNGPAFGVTYEFQVAKFYKGEYGPPFVRNISLPESAPSDSPKNLKIHMIDTNNIRVTWDPPNPQYRNGIISLYQVRYYAIKNEEKTENMINTTETSIILPNLYLGEYSIYVRAFTKAGAGVWSNPAHYYRLAGQDLPVPINVKVSRKKVTELEVSWSLPENSENDQRFSKVYGYSILYAPKGENQKWEKHYTETSDIKTIIKNVGISDLYQVKVAAVNSGGLNGNFSLIGEEAMSKSPRLNPQTVRNLRCSVLSSKMLKLEWLAPTITTDIIRFEILYSANLRYISEINRVKEEFIRDIRKFVDFKANVQEYFIKLDDLQSNANYTIMVRPIYADGGKRGSSQSLLQTECRTHFSLPDIIEPPLPYDVVYEKMLLKLKLFRCTERNGPLANYTVVIGPYKGTSDDRLLNLKNPDEYSFMQLAINTKTKEYNAPYIVITGSPSHLFQEKGVNFTEVSLGSDRIETDSNSQTPNTKLEPLWYYKLFMRACIEEHGNLMCKSSNWSQPFNLKEMMHKKLFDAKRVSNKKNLKNQNGDVSYTIVLICFLSVGVILAMVCIVVGCVIRRKKSKKRVINISNNNHRSSLSSSILLKASLTNDIRSGDKCLLVSDLEMLRNHSKKYSTAPDLVTAESVLMCQDGSKLSPVLLNGSKRSPNNMHRLEVSHSIDSTEKLPTAVCNLYQYISDLKANDGALLQSEFETLNTNLDDRFSWQRSNIDCNKSKNRYANVVAYDHTSVLLRPFGDVIGSDYINANFIDGYQKQNAYIATQGPLPDTTDDFWRMVWEQNSSAIVMMTRLEERSGVKCHQYWPNRGFICYGQMIVCHVESFSFAYYTIRVFELRHNKFTEKREIHHFQFTAWPDHGVPKLSTPLLMFIRRYRSMIKADAGPTVVHCSAGVGRTGAFIVIETQLERIKHDNTINVYNYVSKIRCQRNYMVQTQGQYLFILETLLEAIEDGNTEVIASNLQSHAFKLSQIGLTGANELSGFELEFSKLNSLASNRDRHGMMLADFVKAAGNKPVNLTKNKIRNIIPYDWNRVILPAIRGIDGSDYINASFIDGYRDRRAYIAAQSPLPSSVEDFWRMIWDQHCGVVVVLNQPHEEKCHIYWPIHKSIRYQFFVVDPVVEYNMPNYILREFKVTDARDGEFRTLRQFQFTQWPSHGCPKESDSILDFIKQVHKTKEQFGHMESMIVHCSTGSGRTGVFIALSIVIDRLQQESVVDMYQTVKLLHKQRLGLVQTEEQYEFCYKAVVDYLSFFEKNEKNCVD